MSEIKEVSEQMRTYLGRSRGSDEWGYITTKGENGKLCVRAFDRAEIDLVTAKIVGYQGVKQ
jgi:hypothetical protein